MICNKIRYAYYLRRQCYRVDITDLEVCVCATYLILCTRILDAQILNFIKMSSNVFVCHRCKIWF